MSWTRLVMSCVIAGVCVWSSLVFAHSDEHKDESARKKALRAQRRAQRRTEVAA